MSNEQMVSNRFYRWQVARRKLAWIQARIAEGREVAFCTQTRATKITAKNLACVKAARTGIYVQHGRNWLCYDFANLVTI